MRYMSETGFCTGTPALGSAFPKEKWRCPLSQKRREKDQDLVWRRRLLHTARVLTKAWCGKKTVTHTAEGRGSNIKNKSNIKVMPLNALN